MAVTLYVTGTVDIGELSRDLRSLGDDLDQPIRDALAKGAQSIADAARGLMRYRPEGAWLGSTGRDYGHIRDYYAARGATLSASVLTTHPAGPVWEFGGTIHPLLSERHKLLTNPTHRLQQQLQLAAEDKNRPPWTFEIPRLAPVQRAGDEELSSIEDNLEAATQKLLDEYGFTEA